MLLYTFLMISFSSGVSVPVYNTNFGFPLSSSFSSNSNVAPTRFNLNSANPLANKTKRSIPIPSNVRK